MNDSEKTTYKNKVKVKHHHSDWSIVQVSINNSDQFVSVTAKTFNHLLSLGLYPVLFVEGKDGQICTKHPVTGKRVRLARLLANVNSEQMVTVKNGNELDLTDQNLVIVHPNKKPVTYDREEHLSTETLFYDMLEHDWQYPAMQSVPVSYMKQDNGARTNYINQLN